MLAWPALYQPNHLSKSLQSFLEEQEKTCPCVVVLVNGIFRTFQEQTQVQVQVSGSPWQYRWNGDVVNVNEPKLYVPGVVSALSTHLGVCSC